MHLALYNLERQVLHKSSASDSCLEDFIRISTEIEKMIILGRKRKYFKSCASGLLKFVYCFIISKSTCESMSLLYLSKIDPLLAFKSRLGCFGRQQKPISEDLAFAWALEIVESPLLRKIECDKHEFALIFKYTYSQKFGDGISLDFGLEKMSCDYIFSCPEIKQKITVDFEFCMCQDLESFSFHVRDTFFQAYAKYCTMKFVNRDSGSCSRKIIEICRINHNALVKYVKNLKKQQAYTLIDVQELLKHVFEGEVNELSMVESGLVSNELERHGLAIEPDVRFGRQPLAAGQIAIAFPCSYENNTIRKIDHSLMMLIVEVILLSTEWTLANVEKIQLFINNYIKITMSVSKSLCSRLVGYLYFLINNPCELKRETNIIERMRENDTTMLCSLCLTFFAYSDGVSYYKPLSVLNALRLENNDDVSFCEMIKMEQEKTASPKSLKLLQLIKTLGKIFSDVDGHYINILMQLLEKSTWLMQDVESICRSVGVGVADLCCKINSVTLKVAGITVIDKTGQVVIIDNRGMFCTDLQEFTSQMASFSEMHQQQINTFTIPSNGKDSLVALDVPLEASTGDTVARWVPWGEECCVAEIRLSGMVYVGSNLRSLAATWKGIQTEPALIDPLASVAKQNPDYSGSTMGYWPSYSTITPAARLAYLKWLGDGRKDPVVGIGHVFLFFYGLERRALYDILHDFGVKSELPGIILEVQRLLGVYGMNVAFKRYAKNFIDHLHCMQITTVNSDDEPPAIRYCNEFPMDFRVSMGYMASNIMPIPATWAYAWLVLSSEYHLPLQVRRCPEEFKRLFCCRYKEQFGEGLILDGANSNIVHSYRPASASFAQEHVIQTHYPDVALLNEPQEQLRALANSLISELADYDRYMSRHPHDKGSLRAAALLPRELVEGYPSEAMRALVDWIESLGDLTTMPVTDASQLLAMFSLGGANKLTRKEISFLITVLEKLSVGLEPDIRFQGVPLEAGQRVVIFPILPDAPTVPSDDYKAALLSLHLASQVVYVERVMYQDLERCLDEHLEQCYPFTDAERQRLRARLRFLLENTQVLRGVKKQVQEISPEARQTAAFFCVTVACLGGAIENSKMLILKNIFKVLELDESILYSMIHSSATGQNAFQFGAPASSVSSQQVQFERGLNYDIIVEKFFQSETAASFLDSIFVNDEEMQVPVKSFQQDESATAWNFLTGLDQAHARLLSRLLTQSSWARQDFDELAKEHGLMPDGAIEVINEAAFAKFDTAIIDADDDLLLIDISLMEDAAHAGQPNVD